VTPRPGTPSDGAAAGEKPKKAKEPHVVPKQIDLLMEAIETEAASQRWLDTKKREALAKAEDGVYRLDRGRGTHPRRISTRASTTVNFPAVESMPDMLRFAPPPPPVPDKTCCITGKVARYKCPRTGLLYHDLAAFKELRKRHNLPTTIRTNTLADCADFEDPRSELDLPLRPPVAEAPLIGPQRKPDPDAMDLS